MTGNDARIRIGFIIAMAYPLFCRKMNSMAGGAEINLYNLALKFAGDGKYEVTFFVGDYDQPGEEVYDNIRVRKIKYWNYDTGYERYRSPVYKLAREFHLWKEIISSNCDIYINSAAGGLLGRLVLAGKILKGKKVIFRLASDADTQPSSLCNTGKLTAYMAFRFGIRNASLVVSQTEKQRELLLTNMGIDSVVIRNGFLMEEKPISCRKQHILWVSRAVGMKRPDLFVDLAQRLPDKKFLMIMPGENATKKAIIRRISGMHNISLIDYIPFFNIRSYYEDAELLVNTSEYEGFPNTFIQACLARTPILSFRVNPDNFINRYNTGCCCEDSMETAIDFIKELDGEKIGVLGKNAFNYVKANHDIDTSAGRYEDEIFRLLGLKLEKGRCC